jgi:DNA-binding transcriptional ArsR family regulator
MDKNELVDAFGNEARLLIMGSIADQPRYISQIVEDTGLTRPAVCFHLGVLEDVSLVSSAYQVLERPNSPAGRAARVYTLNKEKYHEAMAAFQKLVPEIK